MENIALLFKVMEICLQSDRMLFLNATNAESKEVV